MFTARYAVKPYIKQIRFVFKGLISLTGKLLTFKPAGRASYRYVISVVCLTEKCSTLLAIFPYLGRRQHWILQPYWVSNIDTATMWWAGNCAPIYEAQCRVIFEKGKPKK
jgi:hypothetical protein